MRTKIPGILIITGVLAGCASAPTVPYWENPQWINAMGKTIQNHVQYPTKLTEQNAPAGLAAVEFTYAAGVMQNVAITTSTGNQVLDRAIVTQISKISLPQARGPNADTPHRFQIMVHMVPPNMISFYKRIQEDLQRHASYPWSAVRNENHGIVFVRFQYRNGVIFDPEIYKSSGSPILDQSVINELSNIQAPPAPPWARNQTMRFSVPVVFCIAGIPCTTLVSHYVLEKTVDNATPLCSHIGFNYKHGKISNVHLTRSSGNSDLDKVALSQISKGDFPPPPASMQNKDINFEIPVCYGGKQNAPPQVTPKRPTQG